MADAICIARDTTSTTTRITTHRRLAALGRRIRDITKEASIACNSCHLAANKYTGLA